MRDSEHPQARRLHPATGLPGVSAMRTRRPEAHPGGRLRDGCPSMAWIRHHRAAPWQGSRSAAGKHRAARGPGAPGHGGGHTARTRAAGRLVAEMARTRQLSPVTRLMAGRRDSPRDLGARGRHRRAAVLPAVCSPAGRSARRVNVASLLSVLVDSAHHQEVIMRHPRIIAGHRPGRLLRRPPGPRPDDRVSGVGRTGSRRSARQHYGY
jgi:hypothetical protein